VKFLKQTTPNTMPFSNRPFHTLFQIAVLTSPRPPYEMKNPPMSRDLGIAMGTGAIAMIAMGTGAFAKLLLAL
ncbi:MAG: hypothetical protein NTW21_23090, partial [Verrucomicrobia bacterium]|nr:hypothetical protein [Verrucomicrobiota bacterium]